MFTREILRTFMGCALMLGAPGACSSSEGSSPQVPGQASAAVPSSGAAPDPMPVPNASGGSASGPVAIPTPVPTPLEAARKELSQEEDTNKIERTPVKTEVSLELEAAGTLEGRKHKLIWAGTVEKGAKVTVDGKPVKAKKGGKFRFRVAQLGAQDYESVVVATKGGKRGEVKLRVHRALSDRERGEQFVVGSPDPTYKQLEKDPSAWKGTRVKFRGQIFNIRESDEGAQIQMNVGRGYFGYTSNNLLVVYPRRTPFVRGNVVTVFGTILGPHSYRSVAGWDLTVPAVLAKYVVR